MYIDKKSIPKEIEGEVNMRTLTTKLKQAQANFNNYEHDIIYNEIYQISVEMTYDVHKTRGMKWKVTGVKYIYKIVDGYALTV